MVVVALSIVVLLGALALAVDWGYGLTQRRVLQTAADAAALGAARQLATSVILVDDRIAFAVHGEDVWCEAKRFVDANDAFQIRESTTEFTLQFGSDTDPIVWTSAASALGVCDDPAGSQIVPGDTVYVRVAVSTTYRSLVASVIGRPTIDAAASARAQISGNVPSFAGPIWPMVRHYDPADFDNPCVPGDCDPTEVEPTVFWSSREDDVVYGSFKGLIDPSRYSTRLGGEVPQLTASWDQSGTGAEAKTDYSNGPDKPDQGNCGGPWDTAGSHDPQQYDKTCDIPNWFYYSFLGELSLTEAWDSASLPEGQEQPSPLTERAVCDDESRPDLAPSCGEGNALTGDWVETSLASGNLGDNIADNMRSLIQREGDPNAPFSDRFTKSGKPYGKGLVVIVFLWDCAETYSPGQPGEEWSLIGDGSDCSNVDPNGNEKIDRVHLFTVAPFTFYEGLVSGSEIRGFWGGQYGDVLECSDCTLNPLSNSVALVPDDDHEGP